ncbi:MAG: hypothetical protein QNJ42_24935 [Crocosphaera sp.]|nr:hypothetical protein [Crocosphaera sp.]
MKTQTITNKAIWLIISHEPTQSFNDLIEPNLDIFSNFRLMYSTNNIVSDFGHISLDKIEQECISLNKFFYGSGLLFFSQDIYELNRQGKIATIKIDYSLSLDSNIMERFRIYENGGKVEPKEKFDDLIQFIKKYQFSFDYGFFCLENLQVIKQHNERPFNTLRAIIRCDPLNTIPLDRETAGKIAITKMYSSDNERIHPHFWIRRKIIYLLLLKAIQVNWKTKGQVDSNLRVMIKFCFDKVSKYAEKEIYLTWKLFKYGKSLRFFDGVSQWSTRILSKIKGMSWDYLLIEYQATLAYHPSLGNDFFIPFFASFDARFIELFEACPIRCLLFDDTNGKAYTLFMDHLEFWEDIKKAIKGDYKLIEKFTDQQEILKRSNSQLDINTLDFEILKLEESIKNNAI